jgi:hypothetical protein
MLLELSGLCGLAVALPALDVLGHSPDFLVLERLAAAAVATTVLVNRPWPAVWPGAAR